MDYDILQPWKSLDKWQQDYIQDLNSCTLLCARQVGKTTAMSIKFGDIAVANANETILLVALTERQAFNLFSKTLNYLMVRYPKMVMKGLKKPTKHEINLTNGSKIMCHPTGLTGAGLRTFTCTRIGMDEASRINDEVYDALRPMIAVTKGTIDLASTPCGKAGFFYKETLNPNFKHFYVSAEDCPRHTKEFLEGEKARMSELAYAQEYMAIFLDDMKRFFPQELITRQAKLNRPETLEKNKFYLIGCDIGGLGEDPSTYEVVEKVRDKEWKHRESLISRKTYINEVVDKIKSLHEAYQFKKIYVDDAGIGFGVFSYLLKDSKTASRVEALNNARRPLDRDGEKKTGIMKEDLYTNLLAMLENGTLELLNDDEVIDSFSSVQQEMIREPGKPTRWRIYGTNTHIVEGIARAVWYHQSKSLNLW